MDPYTVTVNAIIEGMKIVALMFEKASPAQQEKLMEFWIEDQIFWRGIIKKLQPPKDTP
jgi:hypothetical protein